MRLRAKPQVVHITAIRTAGYALASLALGGAMALPAQGAAQAAPAHSSAAAGQARNCDTHSSHAASAPLILDPQATYVQSGQPVVSVLAENPDGVGNVSGRVHITRPNGHSIGANSTATGTVPSGNRLTYQLPDGSLKHNGPFRWTLTATNTATGATSCYTSGPGRHPFTPVRPDPHSGRRGWHLTRMPVRVTPGDGALVVGWGRPMLWHGGLGKIHGKPPASGFTTGGKVSYTVTALAPGGRVAAHATAATTHTVLTGLHNGTRYAVHIQARFTHGHTTTDAAGTWSSGRPAAVPGGAAAYVAAVKALLNAEDGLQNGSYPTTGAALAATGTDRVRPACGCGGPSITAWLTAQTAHDQAVGAALKNGKQQLRHDGSTLASPVVSAASDGRTVTVSALATRRFTTVDSSSTHKKRFPGSERIPVSYIFTRHGGQTDLTGYATSDALTVPVTGDSFPTMTSTDAVSPPGAPKQVSTNPATGMFVPARGAHPQAAATSAAVHPDGHTGYRPGIAAWAIANASGTYNGYGNDCTDFASRAMNQGGGMPMNIPLFPLEQHTSDAYWFQFHYFWGLTVSSYSWGGAWQLSDYLWGQGSKFLSYTNQAVPGDIIWANWTGSSWTGISHTGIVTANDGTNLYITQHSNTRVDEPLYLVSGELTWSENHPNLHVWIAEPYEKN